MAATPVKVREHQQVAVVVTRIHLEIGTDAPKDQTVSFATVFTLRIAAVVSVILAAVATSL